MSTQIFKYGNNGEFPFKYVVSRGRCAKSNEVEVWNDHTNSPEVVNLNSKSLGNLNKGFRTSGISPATKRKISKHCKVLALSSQKRQVKNWKGEFITHLCTFITLTLPSQQNHTDAEITKVVLGSFLDKCRKLGLLQNYVWKAEKQKNGNIHYHILTDTFASFSTFQNIWILALEKLNYVEKYTEKFSKMSLYRYGQQPFNANKKPAEIAAAYGRGAQNKWKKPPCIHTMPLSDVRSIAQYISKYVSKSDNDNANIVTGRTWSASQSVTLSVKEFCSSSETNEHWYNVASMILKSKEYVSDFFTMVFCSVQSICAWFPGTSEIFKKILKIHYQPCNYWKKSQGIPT